MLLITTSLLRQKYRLQYYYIHMYASECRCFLCSQTLLVVSKWMVWSVCSFYLEKYSSKQSCSGTSIDLTSLNLQIHIKKCIGTTEYIFMLQLLASLRVGAKRGYYSLSMCVCALPDTGIVLNCYNLASEALAATNV